VYVNAAEQWPTATGGCGSSRSRVPHQFPEERDTDIQTALGENLSPARPRPEHQGGALVEALEAGSFIPRGLLELELFGLQILEGVRRRELLRVKRQWSERRMATFRMPPVVDSLAALFDLTDLEFVLGIVPVPPPAYSAQPLSAMDTSAK
jgi:hypothetical protein